MVKFCIIILHCCNHCCFFIGLSLVQIVWIVVVGIVLIGCAVWLLIKYCKNMENRGHEDIDLTHVNATAV